MDCHALRARNDKVSLARNDGFTEKNRLYFYSSPSLLMPNTVTPCLVWLCCGHLHSQLWILE